MGFRLSDAQELEFFTRGFVILEDVFSQQEVDTMCKETQDLHTIAHGLSSFPGTISVKDDGAIEEQVDFQGTQIIFNEQRKAVKRFVWAGANAPSILHHGAVGALPSYAAQLLEATSLDHIINQINPKNPHDGVLYAPHQDSSFRGVDDITRWDKSLYTKLGFVQTITALKDTTKDNGPIMMYDGSHYLGNLQLPWGLAPEHIEKTYGLSKPTPLHLKAGSIALAHEHIIHYSEPNTSSLSRFTVINGYAYPGANKRIYPGCGRGKRLIL